MCIVHCERPHAHDQHEAGPHLGVILWKNRKVNESVTQTHIRNDPRWLFHVLYNILICNQWHISWRLGRILLTHMALVSFPTHTFQAGLLNPESLPESYVQSHPPPLYYISTSLSPSRSLVHGVWPTSVALSLARRVKVVTSRSKSTSTTATRKINILGFCSVTHVLFVWV